MKYVVGYVDLKSGKTQFRAYDYQNDALEFVDLHKKKGYWAQLYVAQNPQSDSTKKVTPKAQTVLCPVCKKQVAGLLDFGWCGECQEAME